MLKMGLPVGAVKNALQRDGKDASIMDLDPEKSLKSQMGNANEAKDDGPPLNEDPEFTKVLSQNHTSSIQTLMVDSHPFQLFARAFSTSRCSKWDYR